LLKQDPFITDPASAFLTIHSCSAMENLKEKTRDLADHVEDLAGTLYKLTTVHVTQKATNIISGLIIGVLALSVGFIVLLFASLALGWWLGDVVDSRAGGFLIAAGFFLLVLLGIIFTSKKTILPLLRDIIVRKLYD
jgi:hypothetical protein